MGEFGPAYPKINTLWKRDEKNRVIPGSFARPEFEVLKYARFIWTEKLDGTNTRLYWNGQTVTIGGRTDRAVWNPRVYAALEEVAQPVVFRDVYGPKHVVLYGETFGAGIQNGGGYSQDVLFRPFDLRLGTDEGITSNSPFTGRGKILEISHALGVEPVEVLDEADLMYAWMKLELNEYVSTYPGHDLEGIVGRPEVPFYIANHESLSPLLVKMKYRDLTDLRK